MYPPELNYLFGIDPVKPIELLKNEQVQMPGIFKYSSEDFLAKCMLSEGNPEPFVPIKWVSNALENYKLFQLVPHEAVSEAYFDMGLIRFIAFPLQNGMASNVSAIGLAHAISAYRRSAGLAMSKVFPEFICEIKSTTSDGLAPQISRAIIGITQIT